MALARTKVWIAEILTHGDLNAEFDSILNNPIALISPLTGGLDCDGQTLTLDAAAVTTVVSSAAVAWNFTTGAKTGTPATTGSIANWSAQTFTDNNTAGSGTAAAWVGFAIQRPTLAASNTLVTTTDAATWYIPNSPLAGTNQTLTNAWAIWVDAGAVRFDAALRVDGAVTLASSLLSSSATGGIGYTTGAGGTVTQITSKATAVNLATLCGQITTHDASLAADTAVSFTIDAAACAVNDLPIIEHFSGGTQGAYCISLRGGAGTASVTIRNLTAGALAEALVLKFAFLKSAVA